MIETVSNIKHYLKDVDLEKYPLIKANLVDKPDTFEAPYVWFAYKQETLKALFCIKFNYKIPNSVHLGVIEVNKDYRKQGIGTAIINCISDMYSDMEFTLTPKDILNTTRPLTDVYYPSLGFSLVEEDRPYMVRK